MSEKYAVCGILPIIGDFFLSVSRKDDPNKIGFIGGKIDDGEEPEQALLREVLEETGLHVTIEPLDPFVAEDGEYIVYCYMIQLDDKVHEQIAEEETGVIRIASRLQLIKSSPYADYNERAFEWFGV
jgi:8-oxo-dGTP pyrophosphatase MutT (NUDIX family)